MALNRLRTFVLAFSKSLTSPNYYKEVLKTAPTFSVKYYYALVSSITLLTSFVLAIHLTPQIQNQTQLLVSNLANTYPSELEIRITNGELFLNQPQPYVIPLPISLQTTAPPEIQNLVVFDSEGTLNDFDIYKTLILINSVNILIQTPTDIDVYPLAQMPDTDITNQSVEEFLSQLNALINYIGIFVFALILILTGFYNFIIRTIYLILAALSLLVIANIHVKKITFSKLYQICLHAATIPFVIDVLTVIFLQSLLPSFWFFMSVLLIGNFVLLSMNSKVKN